MCVGCVYMEADGRQTVYNVNKHPCTGSQTFTDTLHGPTGKHRHTSVRDHSSVNNRS